MKTKLLSLLTAFMLAVSPVLAVPTIETIDLTMNDCQFFKSTDRYMISADYDEGDVYTQFLLDLALKSTLLGEYDESDIMSNDESNKIIIYEGESESTYYISTMNISITSGTISGSYILSGSIITTDGKTFSLKLTNLGDKITLSETDFAFPNTSIIYGTIHDVTLTRSMTANKWNTLCVPFTMTEDDVQSNFGTEVKVEKMTNITADGFVEFVSTNTIEAGEMYIVKPTSNVNQIDVANKIIPLASGHKTFNDSGFDVYSNFEAISVDAEFPCMYILSNNKFYMIDTDDFEIKGYRWYVQDSRGNGAKNLRFAVDGEETNINVLNTCGKVNGKYLENGRIVINKNGVKYSIIGNRIK